MHTHQRQAETPGVGADEVQEEVVHGDVAAFGDAADKLGVHGVVEVMGIGVEGGVFPQAKGLVDLEVEADGGHGRDYIAAREFWAQRNP